MAKKTYTRAELQKLITKWSKDCFINEIAPTKTNLLIAIKRTRQTVNDWPNSQPHLWELIEHANLLIEEYWTQELLRKKGSPIGAMFYLKAAMGYRENVVQDTDKINIVIHTGDKGQHTLLSKPKPKPKPRAKPKAVVAKKK